MSYVISREKELLKLNEEIDKKAQLGADKVTITSRVLSPRNGRAPCYRRASIEVEKVNLKSSARAAASQKNSSLPRPTSKKERDSRNSTDLKIGNQSLRLSKVENSSIISERKIRTPSKIPSPKNDSKIIDAKKYEKPPIKTRTTQGKASTMPKNHKDFPTISSKVVEKEQILLEINSKLDKQNKSVLDESKENIVELSTDTSKNSEKRVRTPPKSPIKQNEGRKTPSPERKGVSNSLTETYRNLNFKESPSTEALSSKFKDCFGDKHLESGPSVEGITASSTKKSLKQVPNSTLKLNRKTVSTDGLIKYLKSKLSILESELEDNMVLLKKRSDELKASHDKQKKLEAQRDQAISKNNALTDQMNKLEDKLLCSERQLKDRESEYTANLRELETLRREIRVITQANANLEKRLYRSNEELENVKNSLSCIKEAEREFKESIRVERQTQEKQIKTLKKQRSDLLTAYKKQLYLIDNLRRQNICMEQARMISFGEKEFTKVLEWNTHN